MDRLKQLFQRETSYEPLEGGSETRDGEPIVQPDDQRFSWVDYSVFMLLGVSMLWAWSALWLFCFCLRC